MTKRDNEQQPAPFACPKCGCRHLPVLYTRRVRVAKQEIVRRRRECRNCKHRMTTSESIGGVLDA